MSALYDAPNHLEASGNDGPIGSSAFGQNAAFGNNRRGSLGGAPTSGVSAVVRGAVIAT